jgi:hypothetical protein
MSSGIQNTKKWDILSNSLYFVDSTTETKVSLVVSLNEINTEIKNIKELLNNEKSEREYGDIIINENLLEEKKRAIESEALINENLLEEKKRAIESEALINERIDSLGFNDSTFGNRISMLENKMSRIEKILLSLVNL